MGRDSISRFEKRGLTHRQWKSWLSYMARIPLPADRADFNAAWIRGTIISTTPGAKRVDMRNLLPPYGRPPRQKQDWRQMKEQANEVAKIQRENRTRRRK